MNVQSEGSKALDQREHNEDASSKRVVLRYQDPVDGEWRNYNPSSSGLIERYDTSGGKVVYVGTAMRGSEETDSSWTITKYDFTTSGNSSGLVAVGVQWVNRATETYI